MNPIEVQIGQRVQHESRGYGRIVEIAGAGSVGVEFDNRFTGAHNCDGNARNGHGWYESPHHLELIADIDAVLEDLMDESELRPRGAVVDPDFAPSEYMPAEQSIGRILRRARMHMPKNNFDPPYEPENREVKPLKLNELTQGLPLLGLRIMINPEKQNRYRDKYHGQSGIIVSLRGNNRDAYRQITRLKRGEAVTDWTCTVSFDDGNTTDVRIGDMLPITPEKEVKLHEIFFDNGEKMRWTEEQYEKDIDKYIINYQWNISKHILWDDKERQKVLDEH